MLETLKKIYKHLVITVTPMCLEPCVFIQLHVMKNSDSIGFPLQVNNAERTLMWRLKDIKRVRTLWIWSSGRNIMTASGYGVPTSTYFTHQPISLSAEASDNPGMDTTWADAGGMVACTHHFNIAFRLQLIEMLAALFSFSFCRAIIGGTWWCFASLGSTLLERANIQLLSIFIVYF